MSSKNERKKGLGRGLSSFLDVDNFGEIVDKKEDEKKVIRLKVFKNNVFKLSYGKKKHYLVKII